MAKLVMVGEEHFSLNRGKIGDAVKERINRIKPKKFIILAEGPFFTREEKESLNGGIMTVPTAGILEFLNLSNGEELEKLMASDGRRYLKDIGVSDYGEHIESIESPAFLLLPRVARVGLMDDIDDNEKSLLNDYKSLLKTIIDVWRYSKMNECIILTEYLEIIELNLKIRTGFNYLERKPQRMDFLDLNEGDLHGIERIYSGLPHDMLDDMKMLLSKIRITFRLRSMLHADKIEDVAGRDEHDLLITITGAGHIPDVVDMLKMKGMDILSGIIFTDSFHIEYEKIIRGIEPDIPVAYLG